MGSKMIYASECLLPKIEDHYQVPCDFIFFKNEDKRQMNLVKYKFVGQKVFESNQLAEFSLANEAPKCKDTFRQISRPRNCFIIMRTLLHNRIIECLEQCDISSLKHVSAITSQLWGKNDGIFQLYFELLSQFEEHWHLNIYPEYRYHKVNKISRQLENKLVYQNMLNRMRYFTASSLSSKLEGIVTFPAASAADVSTAAEPFSSTYTYSSLSSSQTGVNHQHHYRQQYRQMMETTFTPSQFQQQGFATLQEPELLETLQNKHSRTNNSNHGNVKGNSKSFPLTQEILCDRIKFDLPKNSRRTPMTVKRTRTTNITKSKATLNKHQKASKAAMTPFYAELNNLATQTSSSIERAAQTDGHNTDPQYLSFRKNDGTNVSLTKLASRPYHYSTNSIDSEITMLYLGQQCMVGSQQHSNVQDVFLENTNLLVLSSERR